MATKKPRRRRKKGSSGDASALMTVTLQPGQVPSDEQLEAEAAALDEETQGKYELAKKDDLDLAALQHMTTTELGKVARKEKIEDFATMPKQRLVFEVLKARAQKQGLMIGEGTLEVLPDRYGFLRSPEYS
jgi:transcription termination factor Rho